MKRKIMLTAGGILAALSILILVDMLRPGLFWTGPAAAVSPEIKKLQEIEASYRFGVEQAQGGLQIDKVCLGIEGVNLSACLQGVFFANFSRAIDVQRLDESPPPNLNPTSTPIWYTALGMAIAHHNKTPTEIKERIKNIEFFNYVIDGWAFMSVRGTSLLPTLERCRQLFADEQLKACVFGAGRATFYAPQELAALSGEIPKELVFGYLFAKGFSLETPANATTSPAIQLAAQVVAAWKGQSANSCIKDNYLIKCLDTAPGKIKTIDGSK